MNVPTQRKPPGRARTEDSPASLDEILGTALRAFATHGYGGVSLGTINRNWA